MSFRHAFALPAALWLAGAVTLPAAAEDTTAPEHDAGDAAATAAPALTPEQEMQVQYQILTGEMAAGRGQPALAAEAFIRALEVNPDPELAARTTQLALAGGKPAIARKAAQRWLELEPNSMDAREVLARLALREGDLDEVYAQSLEMIRGHAGGLAEGFRHVALLLSGDDDRAEAVMLSMDRLVAAYPDLAAARYARALAALRYEKLDAAERSAREALKLEPGSRDYRLLLAGVLVRSAQLEESDALIDSLLAEAEPAQRAEVRMTYARLLLDAGQREPARAQLRAALGADPKNSDARYALGVMAFNDGDLVQAEQMIAPLTADPDRGGDASFQLGRIAESRRDYEQALTHYRRVTSGSQAFDAALRQASVTARLGRVDEARASLDQMRRQFPPLAQRLTLAEGELLLDVGRNEEAVALYDAALAAAPDDDALLYGRSLAHERAGRFSAAETDLRDILERDPDDARALNALGYLLTVNTTRYEEARKLIEAALAQTPDDAAVIDSMGWVLFKLGRKEEALAYLEKALDQAKDPEISAHLGEVLWAMGQHDRARQIWDRARARDPDHRVLLDTIERLTR